MKKEIIGSKFILRDLRPVEDKESIMQNANNINVLKWLYNEFPYTESDYEKLVNLTAQHNASGNETGYIFVIDVDGKAVGSISLRFGNKKATEHVAETSYWLGEEYWNRGIMTEALEIITELAFDEHKKMKVVLVAMDDNVGSKRVAEKNGFKLEHVAKKEVFKDGKYKDLVYYTKFNKDIAI